MVVIHQAVVEICSGNDSRMEGRTDGRTDSEVKP